MRKLILTLFIIIGSFAASAQSLLETFERSLESLKTYRVEFEVMVESYSTRGEYVVSGSDFYTKVDGTEYYVAGGVKYEVNNRTKEITIDSAESLGSDLLSNPARGFSVLARDFNSTPATIDGRAAIELTSKQGGEESIVIVADSSGRLPQIICYSYASSSMVIALHNITSCDSLPLFSTTNYVDYELVDMR